MRTYVVVLGNKSGLEDFHFLEIKLKMVELFGAFLFSFLSLFLSQTDKHKHIHAFIQSQNE